MAFGAGNQAAKGADHGKAKLFKQQFTAALNEAHVGGDITKLRAVVNSLIDAAISGDLTAASIVMDRVDGKVPQAVAGADGESALTIELIQRVIVDAAHTSNTDS